MICDKKMADNFGLGVNNYIMFPGYNISNNQRTLHISRNSLALSKVNKEYLSEDLADHCYCALSSHLQGCF